MTTMVVDHLKIITKHLLPSFSLMADSDSAGSRPDNKAVQEKIKISINRQIPVVKFFLLLALIITVVLLEHFT